jgi:small subunit ribosomal protein S6
MDLSYYETVFILTPVLSDQQMKDAVEKFKKVLTDHKAEITHVENWGLRKLAYPIQHKSTGFYHLIEFTADPKTVSALEVEYRRDEKVMRYLTVSLDKHAVAYNEKRKKGEFNKKADFKKEEEVKS